MSQRAKKQQQKKMPLAKRGYLETGNRALKKKIPVEKRRARPARPSRGITEADKIQRLNGGRGTDIRNSSREALATGNNRMTVQSAVTSISQPCQVNGNAFAALAMGAVLDALKKGWGSSQQGGVYFAFVYLTRTFINSANGTVPSLQTAPRWLWEVIAAIKPKSSGFKTGSIAYKWLDGQDGTFIPPADFVLGLYSVVFGVPTAATGNGFSILAIPPGYTDAVGETAVQDMFQFFPDEGMYQRVGDLGDQAFLHEDVSAFQAIYAEWGSSGTSQGGMAISVLAEVPLQCPILAKFSPYQQFLWRGAQSLRKAAGTALYIAPRMGEMVSVHEMKIKTSPIFKFYNFDYYFIHLSYILATALETQNREQAELPLGSCPLSAWQVQMLLRQTLMPRFSNERAADLQQIGTSTLGLFPFSPATNGVSMTSVGNQGMLLPFVFAESVRSANRLFRDITGARGSTKIDIVPVISRPAKPDVPTITNFDYQDKNGVYQPVYTVNVGELDIDLVDLSFSPSGPGGPKTYINGNGDQLVILTETWNKWIKQLGSCLTTLVTVGSEPGIAALSSVISTLRCHTTPPPEVLVGAEPPVVQGKANVSTTTRDAIKRIPSIKHFGVGLKRSKLTLPRPTPGNLGAVFYQNVIATSMTSTMTFDSPLMRYVNAFNLPTNIGILQEVEECTPQFQQVYQIEPNKIEINDSTDQFGSNDGRYVTIDNRFLSAAMLDVKSVLAAKSEVEIELGSMAEQGNGGFFTSLAGSIGEALGISGSRKFADGVSKFIDI